MMTVVLMASILAGCSNKAGGGSTLTVATDSDAISLVPMGSNDNASSKININIYEGLFDISY